MHRKAEAVLEGHLKEANHFRHLDDVRSEKIGAPIINTKGGLIASGEGLSKKRLDLTRAHGFGILFSSPQVVRTAKVPDLTDLALAFSRQGRRSR